jgi:hypothetical protein
VTTVAAGFPAANEHRQAGAPPLDRSLISPAAWVAGRAVVRRGPVWPAEAPLASLPDVVPGEPFGAGPRTASKAF